MAAQQEYLASRRALDVLAAAREDQMVLEVGRIAPGADVGNLVRVEGTNQAEEIHMAFQDIHREGILEALGGRNVD